MTDHEEAACRLQEMLRFDTTNPPGNELALATHLAASLQAEGLQAEVLDLDGESIERSHPITGDHERYPVQWQQGDPPSSKYRFVQLRFRASRASLYSYWFEQVTEPPPYLVGRTELAQPAVHGRERGQIDDVLAPQPCKRRQRHQPQRMPVEDRATPAEKGSAVLDVETCLRCKVEATPCSQIESIQSTSQLISI